MRWDGSVPLSSPNALVSDDSAPASSPRASWAALFSSQTSGTSGLIAMAASVLLTACS